MSEGDEKSRRSATDILDQVKTTAEEELDRGTLHLMVSGLAGGMGMGFTPMGVAALSAYLPKAHWSEAVATLLYPLGFIAVIIGRTQLFTENTLHPVAYVLSERKRLGDTMRLWIAVWVSNVIGAFAFAFLAIRTGALKPEFTNEITRLGTEAVEGSFGQLFLGAVIAGWLIAFTAWMVAAGRSTSGQILSIYFLTLLMGLLQIPHSIAGSGEILGAVLAGSVSFGHYWYWMAAATSGNVVGGVLIVTVLNWAQAHE
jgi:formate-nitrite transporter family protein